MKKNKRLLLLLLILLIPTLYFVVMNSNSTIKKEQSDFALKDTASITKIFIADRNGKQVTLERKADNQWRANDSIEPRPDLLKLLLEAIYRVDVRNRVAKAAYNSIIKSLASSGIKCEIYTNHSKNPTKVYYVGGQTEDNLGTFMLIEDSKVPFVMEIPGFNGYLSPRYSPDVEAWRSPILFKTPLNEIKSLSIQYLAFPEKSFTIDAEKGRYRVRSIAGREITHVDSVAVENYLSLYSNVYYEARAKDLNTHQRDSILNYAPSIKLTLKKISGMENSLSIYPMPITKASLTQQDSTGKPLKYDLDRMYGFISRDKDFVTVQHYNFDRMLRQLSDFDRTRNLEKVNK